MEQNNKLPAFLKTKQKKRSEPGCREDVGWRPLARPPLRITAIGVGQTAGGKVITLSKPFRQFFSLPVRAQECF